MKISKLLAALTLSTAALFNSGCEVCVGTRRIESPCYQQAPCVGYQSPCSTGCYIPQVNSCGAELAAPTVIPSTTSTPKN
jgi:hypothetical protein